MNLQDIIKSLPKIENMTSSNGNDVPNQFLIKGNNFCAFQSYSTIIAVEIYGKGIWLDEEKWDYSKTTGKYRNQFTGLDKAQTLAAIQEGRVKLANLN